MLVPCKIYAILCWSRLLDSVPEHIKAMVDLWSFPNGDEICPEKLAQWWTDFPLPMASVHPLMSLYIKTMHKQKEELQERSEMEKEELEREKAELEEKLEVRWCLNCMQKVPVFFQDSNCLVDFHHPGVYYINGKLLQIHRSNHHWKRLQKQTNRQACSILRIAHKKQRKIGLFISL